MGGESQSVVELGVDWTWTYHMYVVLRYAQSTTGRCGLQGEQ